MILRYVINICVRGNFVFFVSLSQAKNIFYFCMKRNFAIQVIRRKTFVLVGYHLCPWYFVVTMRQIVPSHLGALLSSVRPVHQRACLAQLLIAYFCSFLFLHVSSFFFLHLLTASCLFASSGFLFLFLAPSGF